MNPLRPRILTAGAWFLLSLGLPFALIRELSKHKLWGKSEAWWFKFTRLLVAYWVSCNIFFLFAGSIFLFDDAADTNISKAPKWAIPLVLTVLAFAAVIGLWFFSKLKRGPASIVIFTIFGFIAWAASDDLFFRNKFLHSAVSLWMLMVGAICFYELQTRSWTLKAGDWSQSLVTFFALLLLFATKYYPHIKASWGGGMPIPVNIAFNKDAAVLPGQHIEALLIDETDAGFYVAGKGEKHATFVPRTSVGMMHFAGDEESSIFMPKAR